MGTSPALAGTHKRFAVPRTRHRRIRIVSYIGNPNSSLNCEMPPSLQVGGQPPPRLKIRHRLLAARCVTAIIDRWFRLPRRYRPEPRLVLWRLRVEHDPSDYWSARVTESHVVCALCLNATAKVCISLPGRRDLRSEYKFWAVRQAISSVPKSACRNQRMATDATALAAWACRQPDNK
jgi:hypothetical protein